MNREFAIILLILILANPCLAGGSEGPCSAEAVYNFARHLEDTGDYYRAITEYRRFIFNWPRHDHAVECRYRIGQSYLYGSDYENAISVFQDLYVEKNDALIFSRVKYAYSKSLYYGGYYKRAAAVLRSGRFIGENSRDIKKHSYNLTWCYLKLSDIHSAAEIWQSDNDENKVGYGNPDLRQVVKDLETLPRKNPHLAGIMSAVLPGAGQIYSQRWRDGLISFFVNGLFIGAMAVAIDRGHEETAAVLGFVELGFYSANIYNAVNDAHKYNQIIWAESLSDLEQQFGSPYLDP
ncbi:tetratricopeptide repeat protein [bacterium]|nr:tetratricopeptide repeat protein [bacterium]